MPAEESRERRFQDEEHPADPLGCLLFGVRFLGCTTILYFFMFLAIIAVGLFGLLWFRS